MDRRDFVVAALLSVGLAACLVPFARLGVDLHHDGIMLKPALDVLSGQVLFRDTFMQYGALSCYLQVAALWIHPTLLSIRLMMVAVYVVTLFFLYASWRYILPRSLAVLACGLFVLFIPAHEKNWINQYWILLSWSSVFALMFESIGLYALFRVIRTEQPVTWGLVLGMSCAGAFWCRQTVGLIMAACLVAVWLGLRWTNWPAAGQPVRPILTRIAGGFVAVHAVLLGGIAFSGALPEWWYQNFVWPRKWAPEDVQANWHNLFPAFVHSFAGLWLFLFLLAAAAPAVLRRFRPDLSLRNTLLYYLGLTLLLAWQGERVLPLLALREGGWTALFPFLVLVQAALSIAAGFAGRGKPKSMEYYCVAALAAIALGALLQYYPVPDPWHILWSLGPAFGLVVYVFWRWVGWPAPVATLVLALAFLPALYVKVWSVTQSLHRPLVTLNAPAVLRGLRVSPEQAISFGRITTALQPVLAQQPDISSALIGDDAMFLCFTGNHTNPSPYFVTWKGLAGSAANEDRWRNIQRLRPLMFLQRTRPDADRAFFRGARYVPLLHVPDEALIIAIPQELADALRHFAAAPAGPP